ncbi:alpha/beta hydrolase [Piscinibacter sp.]|uniref:alpha/beta hydrolase n=1 Tax=Piscinibacter sp. TaxID=1903157 RepID=UPI001D2C12D8|nr:alpha/beta hydrolase [Piscinibacter sp.]MBK7529747.1 alpha/beta hydrolase [Piscinibacter sp.]
MPLAPTARAWLDQMSAAGLPPPQWLPLAQFRQMARAWVATHPVPVARVEDRLLSGPGGPLAVRLYWPDAPAPHRMLVYAHGGGFVRGDLDTHDHVCRELCTTAPCLVVSVDYRLAPEHPFPAALEDCLFATRWAHTHAVALGGDARSLLVAGDSAGGNLVAMVCLRAREARDPPIQGQLLFYPVTAHYDPPTPSYGEFAEGYFLTRDTMRWFIDLYLGAAQSPVDAFPLLATDLRDLPPALVMTAECDPLRDEGRAYADRLRDAGVDCSHRCVSGMLHGFMAQTDLHPQARDAMGEACAWIRAIPCGR